MEKVKGFQYYKSFLHFIKKNPQTVSKGGWWVVLLSSPSPCRLHRCHLLSPALTPPSHTHLHLPASHTPPLTPDSPCLWASWLMILTDMSRTRSEETGKIGGTAVGGHYSENGGSTSGILFFLCLIRLIGRDRGSFGGKLLEVKACVVVTSGGYLSHQQRLRALMD